ncbi:MAG: hypothetical protein HN936_02375 [Bacteroidetes bacterium]|jgi:hypothetical protein|nr:hypothetical protein [Bacteroidota bacterium]
MEVNQLEGLIDELEILKGKIQNHSNSGDYIYAQMFDGWVSQYNTVIKKINSISKISVPPYSTDSWDYSNTGKTVRQTAVENLLTAIEKYISRLDGNIIEISESNANKEIPQHQLRKCFKLNVDHCPVNPRLEKNKAFIGMPFKDEYLDSFNYGVKPALESIGYSFFKADEDISNTDIMCKICRELQACSIALINISGLNPNVMLELGLAYGIGKPVIILKDKDTKAIADLGSLEYIKYDHAYDLMQKLIKGLPNILKNKS